MKILKYLLVLVLIVTLASCKSDDDSDPPYLLIYENFAGIHELNFLLANVQTTVVIEGLPITVTSIAEGSVFQIESLFNQNGTYTLEGQFLLTTTTTGGGTSETVEEIIVLDENGNYQLNDTAKTINLTSSNDLLNGTFDVTLFTETEVRMKKEDTSVEGDMTTESEIEIRFIRQ